MCAKCRAMLPAGGSDLQQSLPAAGMSSAGDIH
jgi:hypothetical protein